jgi:cobalamin biosynthesis protein CbiD
VTTVGGASPDGSIYGEGQAVLTTKDGETVIRKGMGVGKPKGKGMTISWRGAKAYQTSSQRLIILNRMPLVLEAEADENGVGWHKHWEWK